MCTRTAYSDANGLNKHERLRCCARTNAYTRTKMHARRTQMHARAHKCLHKQTNLCKPTKMHARTQKCMHTHTKIMYAHTNACTYTQIYTRAHKSMHAHANACMRTQMHARSQKCMHAHNNARKLECMAITHKFAIIFTLACMFARTQLRVCTKVRSHG